MMKNYFRLVPERTCRYRSISCSVHAVLAEVIFLLNAGWLNEMTAVECVDGETETISSLSLSLSPSLALFQYVARIFRREELVNV